MSEPSFITELKRRNVIRMAGLYLAALQELEKSYSQFAAYQVAQVYAYRAETDRAFAWLDRAYRQRDAGLSFVKSDPLLDSLHRSALEGVSRADGTHR